MCNDCHYDSGSLTTTAEEMDTCNMLDEARRNVMEQGEFMDYPQNLKVKLRWDAWPHQSGYKLLYLSNHKN